MKRIIKVSRSGLTECSACEQHIRIQPKVVETICPFCGTPLAVADGEANRSNRSLFAASLVTLALSGCIDDASVPVYGLPVEPDMDTEMEIDMSMDTDMDAGDVDAGDVDAGDVDAGDMMAGPLYGLPGDGD